MKSGDSGQVRDALGSVALRCRGRCKTCYTRVGMHGLKEIYLAALDENIKVWKVRE